MEEKHLKEIILEANNIHYKYSDGTYALSGLSIALKQGQKIGIVGPNGAGKTTLFLHFNGVYKPNSGKIYFQGKEVNYTKKEIAELRSKVGIVFQDPNTQLFSASVYQEISFGPMNLRLSNEEVAKRVDETIDLLKIQELKDRPTHFLSGGEKKKVAIASILAMKPAVIFFDEPFANVDPKSTKELISFLDELNGTGKTIIISSHNVDKIYSWADYIYIINDGNILGEGTPQTVFTNENLLSIANLEKPWIIKIYEEIIRQNPNLEKKYSVPKSNQGLFKMISEL